MNTTLENWCAICGRSFTDTLPPRPKCHDCENCCLCNIEDFSIEPISEPTEPDFSTTNPLHSGATNRVRRRDEAEASGQESREAIARRSPALSRGATGHRGQAQGGSVVCGCGETGGIRSASSVADLDWRTGRHSARDAYGHTSIGRFDPLRIRENPSNYGLTRRSLIASIHSSLNNRSPKDALTSPGRLANPTSIGSTPCQTYAHQPERASARLRPSRRQSSSTTIRGPISIQCLASLATPRRPMTQSCWRSPNPSGIRTHASVKPSWTLTGKGA